MTSGVAAVILAGGEGKRIGGGKPLKMLKGRRLIDLALGQARSWSDAVAIAVREDSQVGAPGAALIHDEPGIEGPLGGLIAGLTFARDQGRELLLTIPSDMPFLPPDLLDRLAAALGRHASALASSGGHVHPVCGLWRVSALERTADYVAGGRRSLRGFAETIGCVAVEWPGEAEDPFFNINSIDDLAEAERRIG